MPYIGKVKKPSATLDHQLSAYDATEELILWGFDYAFIKKDDSFIGIVSLDSMLEEYKSGDISATGVEEFMEPLFFVKESETRLKAVETMLKNGVKHLAVTNTAGNYVGVASLRQLKAKG